MPGMFSHSIFFFLYFFFFFFLFVRRQGDNSSTSACANIYECNSSPYGEHFKFCHQSQVVQLTPCAIYIFILATCVWVWVCRCWAIRKLKIFRLLPDKNMLNLFIATFEGMCQLDGVLTINRIPLRTKMSSSSVSYISIYILCECIHFEPNNTTK